MAKEGLLQIRESVPGSADLSANPDFILVAIDGNGELAVAGAGARAYVLRNAKDVQAQGDEGTIVLVGKTKVVAGAAFSKGDSLASDASGKAITATTGQEIIGIALEDAGGADELAKMLPVHGGTA